MNPLRPWWIVLAVVVAALIGHYARGWENPLHRLVAHTQAMPLMRARLRQIGQDAAPVVLAVGNSRTGTMLAPEPREERLPWPPGRATAVAAAPTFERRDLLFLMSDVLAVRASLVVLPAEVLFPLASRRRDPPDIRAAVAARSQDRHPLSAIDLDTQDKIWSHATLDVSEDGTSIRTLQRAGSRVLIVDIPITETVARLADPALIATRSAHAKALAETTGAAWLGDHPPVQDAWTDDFAHFNLTGANALRPWFDAGVDRALAP